MSKLEEQYGPIADKMALKYKLDPVLFRNQIRQESGFNPKARSGVGAVGISQFMPSTAKGYGYTPKQLIDNPVLALDLAAQHMKKLTDTYGDQRLALAAYNGGGGSIDFVKKKLGKDKITFDDWLNFNRERREKLGYNPVAWHGQTLDYIEKITKNTQPPAAPKAPVLADAGSVIPPPIQTPQEQAPIAPSFDYKSALISKDINHTPTAPIPTSTPVMDEASKRIDQIAQSYDRLMKQQQQRQLEMQQQAQQRQPNNIDKLQAAAQLGSRLFQQPQQQQVQLQGIYQPQEEVQFEQNLGQYYGGFSQ